MDTTKQQEIIDIISGSLVSAEQIANNFGMAKSLLQGEIKTKICEILKERLSDRFEISNNNNTKYSQIWIRFSGEQVPKHIFFGVESFVGNSDLFVGIFNNRPKEKFIDEQMLPPHERLSDCWVNVIQMTDYDNKYINMGNAALLEKLFKNNDLKTKLIERISTTTIDYVNKKAPQLIAFFNR